MVDSKQEIQRPCWDCQRRSTVCDFTHPACQRCTTKGLMCSGYGEAPPRKLKWLAPGKVSSRNRRAPTKKNGTKKNGANVKTKNQLAASPTSSSSTLPTIPALKIRTNASALGEAVEYYNTCIYPEVLAMLELGPNTKVHPISPQIFARTVDRPDYLRYGFVCMALMHRSNRLQDSDPEVSALNRTFLHFRGVMIRSLLLAINEEHVGTSNVVIAGILNLLLLEAHQSSTPEWRNHINGIQQLMMIRGGVRAVAQAPGGEAILPTFAHTTALFDSTSPASDMVIATMHPDDFEFIVDEYGARHYAFSSFPSELFRELVNINFLRSKAAYEPYFMPDLTAEGYRILTRIHIFVPEEWASQKSSFAEEWVLLARINQTAMALYCLSSLQSIHVLPETAVLKNLCGTLARLLHTHLVEAMQSPRSRRSLDWYFIVLGVHSVHLGGGMREFVRTSLVTLSFSNASRRPIAAREILESFWVSGRTTWDECFDKPYALCPPWGLNVRGAT
ncbi:C6 zinc finger domain-containing protein [Penicillium angulare]|uniref:C6 zinc finger domain-containing protein n=1 Tax=Penicillium angulare TaxID=116970 RepID=A0A9W9EG12_9EURO|nr:C6 zinc finger domain-containing protein [Penicillium angulare]